MQKKIEVIYVLICLENCNAAIGSALVPAALP